MSKLHAVTVDLGSSLHTEQFVSKDDAEHWSRMMLLTLARPECKALNLPEYATGLASSVRAYGGGHTYDWWCRQAVHPADWARGAVVPTDEVRDKIMRMLKGPGRR